MAFKDILSFLALYPYMDYIVHIWIGGSNGGRRTCRGGRWSDSARIACRSGDSPPYVGARYAHIFQSCRCVAPQQPGGTRNPWLARQLYFLQVQGWRCWSAFFGHADAHISSAWNV